RAGECHKITAALMAKCNKPSNEEHCYNDQRKNPLLTCGRSFWHHCFNGGVNVEFDINNDHGDVVASAIAFCGSNQALSNLLWCDKVIGAALMDKKLPLGDWTLVVSGRVGYELVQKAVCAGVSALVGVSAPTSLAVDLAHEFGLTLLAFARNGVAKQYLPS
ncbi:MAG: hypothetical protein F2959_02830, partial [Actinobacteria bacterium]|nr:hypothetical protein [Actinomycetota bacterium]